MAAMVSKAARRNIRGSCEVELAVHHLLAVLGDLSIE